MEIPAALIKASNQGGSRRRRRSEESHVPPPGAQRRLSLNISRASALCDGRLMNLSSFCQREANVTLPPPPPPPPRTLGPSIVCERVEELKVHICEGATTSERIVGEVKTTVAVWIEKSTCGRCRMERSESEIQDQ